MPSPDPGSVLDVSDGRTPQNQWVWGIDPSTRLLAIGVAGPDGEQVRSWPFTKNLWHGRRLSDIRRITRSAATLMAEEFPPQIVFVEQPFSRQVHVEPTLYYAVGVITEALYSALEFRYPHPVEVRTIHLSTWKKEAVGNGAAKKADVMAWAVRRGYRGVIQDEADALGIAVGGRRLVEQPEQLPLSA